MPEFDVTLREFCTITVRVKADNHMEAELLAREGIEEDEFGTDPFRDAEIEVVEVLEIKPKKQ